MLRMLGGRTGKERGWRGGKFILFRWKGWVRLTESAVRGRCMRLMSSSGEGRRFLQISACLRVRLRTGRGGLRAMGRGMCLCAVTPALRCLGRGVVC